MKYTNTKLADADVETIIFKTLKQVNFLLIDTDKFVDENGEEYICASCCRKEKSTNALREDIYEFFFDDFNVYTNINISNSKLEQLNNTYAQNMALLNIENQQKYIEDYVKQQVRNSRGYLNSLSVENRKTELQKIKQDSLSLFDDYTMQAVYPDIIYYNYWLNHSFCFKSTPNHSDYINYCKQNADDISQILFDAYTKNSGTIKTCLEKLITNKDDIKETLLDACEQELNDGVTKSNDSKLQTLLITANLDTQVTNKLFQEKFNAYKLRRITNKLEKIAHSKNSFFKDNAKNLYPFQSYKDQYNATKLCLDYFYYKTELSGETPTEKVSKWVDCLSFNDNRYHNGKMRESAIQNLAEYGFDKEFIDNLPTELKLATAIFRVDTTEIYSILKDNLPTLYKTANQINEEVQERFKTLPKEALEYHFRENYKKTIRSNLILGSKSLMILHNLTKNDDALENITTKYQGFDLDKLATAVIKEYPNTQIHDYFENCENLASMSK